jgi:hypothetical protein
MWAHHCDVSVAPPTIAVCVRYLHRFFICFITRFSFDNTPGYDMTTTRQARR